MSIYYCQNCNRLSTAKLNINNNTLKSYNWETAGLIIFTNTYTISSNFSLFPEPLITEQTAVFHVKGRIAKNIYYTHHFTNGVTYTPICINCFSLMDVFAQCRSFFTTYFSPPSFDIRSKDNTYMMDKYNQFIINHFTLPSALIEHNKLVTKDPLLAEKTVLISEEELQTLYENKLYYELDGRTTEELLAIKQFALGG